jgi:cell division protein FtsB
MEDLLKTKDEEIQKLMKLKDALKDQLMKAREELKQLKEAGGGGVSPSGATPAGEDAGKLQQENDALKVEIKTLKEKLDASGAELEDLKFQLTVVKTEAEDAKMLSASKSGEAGAAPAAGVNSEELANLKKENEVLKKANGILREENTKLEDELEKAKKAVPAAPTPESSEPVSDKPLSVDQVLQQVKTGMFKLGQQNFSIEQKIDQILEQMESLGGIPAGPASAAKVDHGLADSARTSSLKHTPAPEPVPEKRGISAPKVSFGGEPEMKTPEPDVFTRKPSEFGKPAEKAAPQRAVALKPTLKTNVDDAPRPKPGGGGPGAGLQTIQYPADGVVKCPNCGEQNFQEMENKAKIISFVPTKKYGRKYYCKLCRAEWDYEF